MSRTAGSLYREAWDIFRGAADLGDIGADDNATLVVDTRAEGNMAKPSSKGEGSDDAGSSEKS